MKFGIRMPANILYPSLVSPWEAKLSGADVIRFAEKVDDLGYDYIWTSEHMIQIPEMAPMMGTWFHEGLTAAAVMLGATKRIKAYTHVAILPYHNPVVYAKAIASLDFLSGGRFVLGAAVGYMEREFEILKVPFKERGQVMDEYLKAMVELWTSDTPSFQGKYVQFDNVIFEPKPVSKPYPPIFFGGDARPVLRRVAEYGSGWLPWLTLPEEIPACVEYIQEQPGFRNNPRPLEVFSIAIYIPPDDKYNAYKYRVPRTREEVTSMLDKIKKIGANATVHPPLLANFEECMEWVEWFAKEIMPQYR